MAIATGTGMPKAKSGLEKPSALRSQLRSGLRLLLLVGQAAETMAAKAARELPLQS